MKTTKEVLSKKREIIHQLDTQIIESIEDGDAFEDAILDIEDMQDRILEKVNHIDTFIRMHTRSQPTGLSVTSPSIPTSLSEPSVRPTPPVSTQPSTVTPSSIDPASTPSTVEPPSHIFTASSSAIERENTTPTTHMTTPLTSPQLYNTSRLPKLELPTFSGNPLSWQSFWDSFDAAVNSNPTLSTIHKFNYLKAQLQGDAARVIAGLPLTEANYAQSIAFLKQRFGQPEKLIDAHTRALIELPGPTNELSSLQLFYDVTENHIRGLASLGVPKESYSQILVSIIRGKLPAPVRRNLARGHDQPRWTLDDLQAALLKEIRVLESGLYTTDLSSGPGTRSTASFYAGIKGGRHPSGGGGKKKTLCAYCKGEHSPTTCAHVTDYQQRLEIVRKANLCFNCLGNHKISQCNSKFRCKQCKHKHHTSLCKPSDGDVPKPTTTAQNTDKQAQPPSQQVNTITAPILRSAHNNKEASPPTVSLLKTAIAPVVGEGIRIQGNILFDEGSQRSFITEETATKLRLTPVGTENIAIAPFGAEYSSPQPIAVGQVSVETEAGDRIPISVLIVPFIAAPLKMSVRASIESFPHLRGLRLAHPITSEHSFHISILIGADYYWTFVEDKIVRGDGPTAQQSKLGFLLSGPISFPMTHVQLNIASMAIATSEEPDLDRFWSVEEAGTSPSISGQGDTFMHHYQATSISQAADGTYTVWFPWKPNHLLLPSNFTTCMR